MLVFEYTIANSNLRILFPVAEQFLLPPGGDASVGVKRGGDSDHILGGDAELVGLTVDEPFHGEGVAIASGEPAMMPLLTLYIAGFYVIP